MRALYFSTISSFVSGFFTPLGFMTRLFPSEPVNLGDELPELGPVVVRLAERLHRARAVVAVFERGLAHLNGDRVDAAHPEPLQLLQLAGTVDLGAEPCHAGVVLDSMLIRLPRRSEVPGHLLGPRSVVAASQEVGQEAREPVLHVFDGGLELGGHEPAGLGARHPEYVRRLVHVEPEKLSPGHGGRTGTKDRAAVPAAGQD
ncbi:hypothetical protein JB92DRAFT_3121023 [Gautieria morchelliformis]|nr:hypothetical protein JB92DRAFT_3121023 [Gautieria morchelliformis]